MPPQTDELQRNTLQENDKCCPYASVLHLRFESHLSGLSDLADIELVYCGRHLFALPGPALCAGIQPS